MPGELPGLQSPIEQRPLRNPYSIFQQGEASVSTLGLNFCQQRSGSIKITIRLFKNDIISETIESPPDSTLRSLRIFIIKTFPFFPTRFLFMLSTGESIDSKLEKSFAVSSLNGIVYLRPHIPLPDTKMSILKAKAEATAMKERLRKKTRGAMQMPRVSRTQSATANVSRIKYSPGKIPGNKEESLQQSLQRPLTADNSILGSSQSHHERTNINLDHDKNEYFDDFEEETEEDFAFRVRSSELASSKVNWGEDQDIVMETIPYEERRILAAVDQINTLQFREEVKLASIGRSSEKKQGDEDTGYKKYLTVAGILPNELNLKEYRLHNGTQAVVASFDERSEFKR